MKNEKGFILRYGNGVAIMPLAEQLFYINTGNVRLVIEGGETIEFNHSGSCDDRENEIIDKYGDYGVKDVTSKYTCTEIVIGELTEEEKQYK